MSKQFEQRCPLKYFPIIDWKQTFWNQNPIINSRTAIAGAIIVLLLVFLQFKEFELYWGAVF